MEADFAPSTSTITPSAFEALISTFLPRFSPVPRNLPFTPAEISHIATLLSLVSPARPSWASRPRVYIVLRLIGCLDLMQAFVVEGKGDDGLPYPSEGLPVDLRADAAVADMFLGRQGLVLDGLEKGSGTARDEGVENDDQTRSIPEATSFVNDEPEDEFTGHTLVPTFSIQHTLSTRSPRGSGSVPSEPRQEPPKVDDEGGTDKIFRQDSRSEKIFRQESKYEKVGFTLGEVESRSIFLPYPPNLKIQIPVIKRRPVGGSRNLPIPIPHQRHSSVSSDLDKMVTDGGSEKITDSSRTSISVDGGWDKMARYDQTDKIPLLTKAIHPFLKHSSTEKIPVYPSSPDQSILPSDSKGSRLSRLFSSSSHPLISASKTGDAPLVASILRGAGPSVNRIVDSGDSWSPLHWASRNGHPSIVRLLLANRMPTNSRTKSQDREPLFFAAQYGHLETCQLLLAANCHVNASSKMDGATALHRAALQGHDRVVSLLISSGADADARDKEGMGPLMWAVQANQPSVVRTLVSNGAKLEARSEAGLTALHRAVSAKNLAMTTLLLSVGADANADGPMGMHPLHRAAAGNVAEIVALLVEYGAELELRTEKGWTALHCAARYGYVEVGDLLIRCGADRGAINGKGHRPRELAVEWEHEAIASSF